MITAEWIVGGIITVLVGALGWLIQWLMAGQKEAIQNVGKKLEKQGEKLEKQSETLTEIKLGLRECITWSDLEKAVGPIEQGHKDHEHRLTVLETCHLNDGK